MSISLIMEYHKQKCFPAEKTLSVQQGFFIPGGTAMFGKFKDLHSCIKACEITPTCFAGDFNPWLGKCFFHGNTTACGSMQAHKAITHFKKVPCGKNVLPSQSMHIIPSINSNIILFCFLIPPYI